MNVQTWGALYIIHQLTKVCDIFVIKFTHLNRQHHEKDQIFQLNKMFPNKNIFRITFHKGLGKTSRSVLDVHFIILTHCLGYTQPCKVTIVEWNVYRQLRSNAARILQTVFLNPADHLKSYQDRLMTFVCHQQSHTFLLFNFVDLFKFV